MKAAFESQIDDPEVIAAQENAVNTAVNVGLLDVVRVIAKSGGEVYPNLYRREWGEMQFNFNSDLGIADVFKAASPSETLFHSNGDTLTTLHDGPWIDRAVEYACEIRRNPEKLKL